VRKVLPQYCAHNLPPYPIVGNNIQHVRLSVRKEKLVKLPAFPRPYKNYMRLLGWSLFSLCFRTRNNGGQNLGLARQDFVPHQFQKPVLRPLPRKRSPQPQPHDQETNQQEDQTFGTVEVDAVKQLRQVWTKHFGAIIGWQPSTSFYFLSHLLFLFLNFLATPVDDGISKECLFCGF